MDDRAAVFAAIVAAHHAAELLRNQLGAVTDAENRDAELVDGGVEPRCTFDMHALRSPGEHDGARGPIGDLRRGDVVGHDLGVHPQLTYTAGDQLGVLGPEVDDQDHLVGGGGARSPGNGRRTHDTTITSAFCRSLSRSNPSVAIDWRRAPTMLVRPSPSFAGPLRICSREPTWSIWTSVPWGSSG